MHYCPLIIIVNCTEESRCVQDCVVGGVVVPVMSEEVLEGIRSPQGHDYAIDQAKWAGVQKVNRAGGRDV